MKQVSDRAELEARLEATQSSIQSRLSSIESAVKVPRVEDVATEGLGKIGASVAAGLVVAWGVSRLLRPRRGDEGYAEDVAEDIERFVDDGQDMSGAVRRALRRNRRREAGVEKSGGGLMAALVMLAARSTINAVVRGLLDRSMGASNPEKSNPEQE